MGDIERPELLPDCEVPARYRQPDELILDCLTNLTDESLADNRRISSLDACGIRGGADLAAATFMVKTPGPWHGDLQRILRASHVNVDRPRFTHGDYVLGLCYVAGAKGLPTGMRHRAVDDLVSRFRDNVGYAEARHLLSKNDWDWLADAVREGWAVWTAQLFAGDETAPLKTRMRVGLALAEHETPAGYVPEAVAQLVAQPGGASSDRLAMAVAVARRDPKAGLDLLCRVASDPVVQAGHRMQAIELLDESAPAKAQEMRALQTRLPSGREARDRQREAVERAQREETARRERETPEAVIERLDAEIEEILDSLRVRDSDDDFGGRLDNHLAETDWEGVAQDIVDIFDPVGDEEIDVSVRLLATMTRIRYGDEIEAVPDESVPDDPDADGIPRLTREELEAYAKEHAERSWTTWKELVEKHGWDDDDRTGEVERQADETTRHVDDMVLQKASDHLRDLEQHLMWEVWPAFLGAAAERKYATALHHLATARLVADEAEHAEVLWKDATVKSYSFDPLSMSWPREFWLVLEEWRHGATGR
ncbi:hypothetical protein QQY66_37640 [Streptomyces sp. DG2A-72]|uniref:hypothetical protein n=1 Tax=Streptomyces sp. DG2A-72 TaxID=3051386 RepID=UPI00265BC4B3|nr:hypothetical protein [Streptomyces sp. DG2A-72]MDO0937164.1 hypothetical protein [Streptomyces sp. DG2A-72]